MSTALLAFIDGPEGIVVLVVLLLVFGANRVPKLARQLGQAQRELKKGIQEGFDGDKADGDKADAVNADAVNADAVNADVANADADATVVDETWTATATAAEPARGAFQPPLPPPSV